MLVADRWRICEPTSLDEALHKRNSSYRCFTMVMVTHGLEEAIYLADRVLILPKEKGGAARLITVDLPPPRERSETRFVRYREELLREFALH